MESARFYDGKSSQPLQVQLEMTALDFRVLGPDGARLRDWAWADMTVVSPPGGGLRAVLSHKLEPDCRLIVPDDVWTSQVAPHLPPPERLPGAPVVALLCLASIIFAAVLIFASPQALDVVARYVPNSWEDELGAYVLPQVAGDKVCKGTPPAKAALERLASALDVKHRSFDVTVSNIAMINAFSLPGRHIILFNGLINRAATPELLAGVIAHEVGHSHYRHPLRMAVQTAGGQLLLTLAFGGAATMNTAMTAAQELLMLKGSREFELQADAYAVPALLRINVDPSNLMQFLAYMAKQMPEMDDVPQWLSNHPITKERIADLKDQIAKLKENPDFGKAPISAAEWKAIKNYCKH